jgi:hypothetical protein
LCNFPIFWEKVRKSTKLVIQIRILPAEKDSAALNQCPHGWADEEKLILLRADKIEHRNGQRTSRESLPTLIY